MNLDVDIDQRSTGKYTNDVLFLALEYLDKWSEYDAIPSKAGLALHCGICGRTLELWLADERMTEISEIVSTLTTMQERELLNKGVTGKVNATITKLVLGKHGYHDKVDNSSSDGSYKHTVIEVVGVPVTSEGTQEAIEATGQIEDHTQE